MAVIRQLFEIPVGLIFGNVTTIHNNRIARDYTVCVSDVDGAVSSDDAP